MLPALATTSDLTARGITIPAGMDDATLLDAASQEVREAAGCPILEATSTVTFVVEDRCQFDLPGSPVTAVSSVTVDSVAVTGWELFGATVTMPDGWTHCLPKLVTVTYTHGLPEVPADIVDLVCGMVSIAANTGETYGDDTVGSSVKLGEYSESRTRAPGTASPSPMTLPDAVRNRLRARFGTSAVMVGQ